MNENEYLTEGKGGAFIKGALKDVAGVNVDEVNDLETAAKEMQHGATAAGELNKMMAGTRVDNRSIFARAKNSVMQFPCYVTQSIPVNAAQVISKTFERVYASFVQAAISQYKVIDEAEANDLLFLKRFHTNIRESAEVMVNSFYEPIDEFDAIMQESVFHKEQISPTMSVEFSCIPADSAEFLIKESARLSHEPLEGFTYLQEADNEGGYLGKKAKDHKQAEEDKRYINSEEKSVKETPLTNDQLVDIVASRVNLSQSDVLALKGKNNGNIDPDVQKKFDNGLIDFKAEINNKKNDDKYPYKIDAAGNVYMVSTTTNSKRVSRSAPESIKGPDAPVLLKEVDIKKLNNIAPYMIACHFKIRSSKGDLDTDAHYVIGVKTIMHLIRPQDLSDDLRDLVTGKIKSLQKVRYKTGEITWWDYIFHKSQIKKDAAKATNYTKRWINTLKRLSEFDKVNGSLMRGPIAGLNKGEIPIPNATLILSQPDVTRLTNETGIDLSVVSNAVRLSKSLYLICVAIVDASAGTMRYIFPDNMTDWDVQSLASMEAEVAKTDNSQLMRELNHLVNK